MRTKEQVKREVLAAIDARAERIVEIGERIRRNPELGFKEVKAARLVEETFAGLGLAAKTGLALTGVRAEIRGRGDGLTLALLGELDGLVVSDHPLADPVTGAAHACGHNCQIAGLLGAAIGLVDAKAMDALSGRIVFFAVPAEEYGDIEWRVDEARQGRLEFLGGKPELLRLGHFDDVDLAMMIHTTARPEDRKAAVGVSNNGCIVKTVRYLGRAAHAGGAPHRGINALYAATIGLAAINALRETFRDEDTIRVHPIITHGGSQVNVIPSLVRIETYVRGKTVEAILEANIKVDRALRAGALALGAKVEIETLPGYLPLYNNDAMAKVFKDVAIGLVGEEYFASAGHRTGSTDMGDISHVMPALHPYMGGAAGGHHAADFAIADPVLAYVMPAKVLALTALEVLWDGGALAREVLRSSKPRMTKEEYLAFQRTIHRQEVFDGGVPSPVSSPPHPASPRGGEEKR
ncbi:MAG: amidohydrolase [Candidatus Rokubacteria bacterium]|nr:amidohydrolase [Candidatus Rokubacteria bacterium]